MPRDSSFSGERVLMRRILWFVLSIFLFAGAGFATVFGTVRGIVHDPQHRPVSDIPVVLKARASEFTLTTRTDDAGQFHFDAVPLGEYTVAVSDSNFTADQKTSRYSAGLRLFCILSYDFPHRTRRYLSPPTPGRLKPSRLRLSSTACKFRKLPEP